VAALLVVGRERLPGQSASLDPGDGEGRPSRLRRCDGPTIPAYYGLVARATCMNTASRRKDIAEFAGLIEATRLVIPRGSSRPINGRRRSWASKRWRAVKTSGLLPGRTAVPVCHSAANGPARPECASAVARRRHTHQHVTAAPALSESAPDRHCAGEQAAGRCIPDVRYGRLSMTAYHHGWRCAGRPGLPGRGEAVVPSTLRLFRPRGRDDA